MLTRRVGGIQRRAMKTRGEDCSLGEVTESGVMGRAGIAERGDPGCHREFFAPFSIQDQAESVEHTDRWSVRRAGYRAEGQFPGRQQIARRARGFHEPRSGS
jgi:hypothetical protein